MQEKYTISELARLFGISNQTLRYYDKIGLFQPAQTDRNTGYRYYSYNQFFQLSMIIQLKRLNFSLENIRKYSSARDIRCLAQNLVEERSLIQEQITFLQHLQERNDRLLQKLRFAQRVPEQQTCEIITEPDRYQYEIMINFEIKDIYHYMKLMYESYIKSPCATNIAAHGEVILKIFRENLREQRFRIYNSIGFLTDGDTARQGISKINGGTFASCVHYGSYDSIHRSYHKLYQFITERGLEICGDSIEFAIISTALTENPDNFITQIQIPIQPK